MSYCAIQRGQMSWRDAGKFNTEKIPRPGYASKIKDWLATRTDPMFSVAEVSTATGVDASQARQVVMWLVRHGNVKALRFDMFERVACK